MRRGPRRAATAGAVVMAELRSAGAAACPVLTGVVGGIGKSPAIRLRAREHIVLIRVVPKTVDRLALLGKRRLLCTSIALSRAFNPFAVRDALILPDPGAL